VALCQARTSTKPLWGLSSSNPYHPSHVPNRLSGKNGLKKTGKTGTTGTEQKLTKICINYIVKYMLIVYRKKYKYENWWINQLKLLKQIKKRFFFSANKRINSYSTVHLVGYI
jgi:hypothetical protein